MFSFEQSFTELLIEISIGDSSSYQTFDTASYQTGVGDFDTRLVHIFPVGEKCHPDGIKVNILVSFYQILLPRTLFACSK